MSTLEHRRTGAIASVAAMLGAALFAVAPAAHATTTVVVPANKVDTSDTRPTGHNDFSTAGVHVWTEGATSTDKAAGYFDSGVTLAAAGEPSMTWTATAGVAQTLRPGLQLVVDFDGNGSADGILVGEPTYADGSTLYGNNWWLSNSASQFVKDAAPSHAGGYGSDNNGTLDQWRADFPSAKIISAGWSLGSGVKGDGTISAITVGSTVYKFAPATATTTTAVKTSKVDFSQTRSNGYWQLTKANALRIWTDGSTDTETVNGTTQNSDKVAGYITTKLALADALPAQVNFTNTSAGSVPGVQLVLDINGDGVEDGTLVGEPLYPGIYWLAKSTLTHGAANATLVAGAPRAAGSAGVPSYSAGGGTAAEWRVAFPNAKVIAVGFSLGSGAKGDGLITSIQAGTNTYTFAGPSTTPVAKALTLTVHANSASTGNSASAVLPVTPTTEGFTYTLSGVSHGTATVIGRTVTFTPAAGYVGTTTFSYKASDGISTSGSAVVTVKVTNSAPVGKNVTLSTTLGVPVTTTLTATDSDDPASALVYSIVTKPLIGTATIVGNQLTYTPSAKLKGSVAFTYKVSDGFTSNTYVVVVTVK